MAETALRRLAAYFGIVPEEEPAASAEPDASEEHLLAILRAAGIDLASPAEAEESLRQVMAAADRRLLAPVTVHCETDGPLRLTIRLIANDTRRYTWTLIEESGRRCRGSFSSRDLALSGSLPQRQGEAAEYLLEIAKQPPGGYHRLILSADGKTEEEGLASMLVIVVPERCFTPPGMAGNGRVWGLSLYLHAIRSRRNWGIGDFSDLQRIFSWCAVQGAGVVHTAPLHQLDTGSPIRPNPYGASSRSHLNPLFIDLEAVPEFADCSEVRELINDVRYQARLAAVRRQETIDYDELCRMKGDALRILWRYFRANHLNPATSRGEEFRRFQKDGGELLHAFAVYSAIRENHEAAGLERQDWRNWPEQLNHPEAEGIADYIRQHENEIGYHQYKQWLAANQLVAIGRRSMELGLKVGLLADFPCSHSETGFESWYYQDLLFAGALTAPQHQGRAGVDPATGLPLAVPRRLAEKGYQPLIAGLRQTMRQAGAICLRSIDRYARSGVRLTAGKGEKTAVTVHYPFADILGIIALESQRNRCLVVADQVELLSAEQQAELRRRNFYSWNTLFQPHDPEASSLTAAFPAKAVLSASTSFLAGLNGLWQGRDISIKTEENMYPSGGDREAEILERASGRARFLLGLEREGLLPQGCGIDQSSLPEIDQPLMAAAQVLLARSAAKILLVAVSDLLGRQQQASPPVMSDQSFWFERETTSLEEIFDSEEIAELFLALRRERGLGVVRPSASATDRGKRQGLRVPTAFYRLQLHKGFTFLQAAGIVPYLSRLGISHCYVSPFLKARSGSLHGYDIIDHGCLNPEIGSREDFEQLIAVLEQHGMALLLDIVPNHMGVGSDNQWWMDVLENGEASLYSNFFDINWQPLQWDMAGRVLVPVLGDHYGRVLEDGQLVLQFQENEGSFAVSYYEHRFPIDPGTYPAILQHDLGRLGEQLGEQHNGFLEFQSIVRSFANLPDRKKDPDEKAIVRSREKEINKRLLARLCGEHPEIRRFIEENVILFNGERGKPSSYDLLHNLLEQQAYRLTFWRVAADEINYRRFFDINELAGLRMEEPEVFEKTHELVIDLITTGKVDGLRVDHPDGLYDPRQYFERLDQAAARDCCPVIPPASEERQGEAGFSLYVVVEKILADHEHLPGDWPVCGTTGYEFSRVLNGLFVNAASEKAMTALYHQFIGERLDFDEILYASKKHIITSALAGELNVLASLLFRLARQDRTSRDFTLNLLRQGLTEVVACFPVYRTYINSERIEKRDADFVRWAVSRARARKPFSDESVLDFIQEVLLLQNIAERQRLPRYLDFVMRLQQYTGPVMAKGLEDTAFYRYNRLLSLNEVGGNPTCFGISTAAFHQANASRMQYWPNSMVSSSTHDSKRSEDVRARINVLTEKVSSWRRRVFRWSKWNHRVKTDLDGLTAPARNDEYAFYQNLLGAWPARIPEGAEHRRFVERMVEASIKSCREAKHHTSWVTPNAPYEDSVRRFVEGVLASTNGTFFDDFLAFHTTIAWFGMLNSLSQVFLKLVVPGIPDIYQGNETWNLCLVDPDNRRPVDFARRQAMLCSMLERMEERSAADEAFLQELLANLPDGRAKMYTIYRALAVRNSWPDLFSRGTYMPLEVTGRKGEHICAFQRILGDRRIIAAAPRLYATLLQGRTVLPLGEEIWGDAAVTLPPDALDLVWENVFTGKTAEGVLVDTGSGCLQAAALFHSWPVALLVGSIQ